MKKIISALSALVIILSFACVSVSAEVYSQGDVDMDKSPTVQASDIAKMRRILLGEDKTAMADVNEDGYIDIRDLVHAKKLSAVTPGININNGTNTFDFS